MSDEVPIPRWPTDAERITALEVTAKALSEEIEKQRKRGEQHDRVLWVGIGCLAVMQFLWVNVFNRVVK